MSDFDGPFFCFFSMICGFAASSSLLASSRLLCGLGLLHALSLCVFLLLRFSQRFDTRMDWPRRVYALVVAGHAALVRFSVPSFGVHLNTGHLVEGTSEQVEKRGCSAGPPFVSRARVLF